MVGCAVGHPLLTKLHCISSLKRCNLSVSSIRNAGSKILAYRDNRPKNSTIDTKPLVILHGLFGSKNNWTTLSKSLAETCRARVITVDARNHGDSFHSAEKMTYFLLAQDVAKLLYHLNISSAHVLGHSMGGKTAMVLALSKPEVVNTLIVEDASPVVSPNMSDIRVYASAMRQVKLKGQTLTDVKKAAMKTLAPDVPNMGIRTFLVQNIVADGDQSYRWRVNLDVLESSLTSLGDWDNSVNENVYDGPCFFLGGANSPYLTDPEYCNENLLKRMFPRASIELIDDAGHWVHSEQPIKFKERVSAFIRSHYS